MYPEFLRALAKCSAAQKLKKLIFNVFPRGMDREEQLEVGSLFVKCLMVMENLQSLMICECDEAELNKKILDATRALPLRSIDLSCSSTKSKQAVTLIEHFGETLESVKMRLPFLRHKNDVLAGDAEADALAQILNKPDNKLMKISLPHAEISSEAAERLFQAVATSQVSHLAIRPTQTGWGSSVDTLAAYLKDQSCALVDLHLHDASAHSAVLFKALAKNKSVQRAIFPNTNALPPNPDVEPFKTGFKRLRRLSRKNSTLREFESYYWISEIQEMLDKNNSEGLELEN